MFILKVSGIQIYINITQLFSVFCVVITEESFCMIALYHETHMTNVLFNPIYVIRMEKNIFVY